MALGKNIKALRQKLKLTQLQFAARLDCDPSSVSRWERGKEVPNLDHLACIARVGAVSVDDLLSVAV